MTDIELAALHGEFIQEDNLGPDAYLFNFDRLKAFADAIRQDQIERDAKICDNMFIRGLCSDYGECVEYQACADDCAEAIRNQLSELDTGSANQLRKEDE